MDIMEQLRFDGKVAIVTGAGNGLGRAHAMLLAARGAKVVVNDLGGSRHGEGKSSEAADRVVSEIRAAGGEAVANYDSVEDGDRIVKAAIDAYGTVDIVIANAGILRDVSFHKMTVEDWDLVLRVHLYGSFRTIHAAWPILRDKGYGRVILTTSAAGIYGNFGQANYGAAKLGIVGLANTLAVEGKPKGVLVNAIAPLAGSRLTETIMPQEMVDALKPEYVSPLVAWLCHETCPETGGLFEIGAGFVSKLRWERTTGETFRIGREIAPEAIASKWASITDFSYSTHPADAQEALQPALENVNNTSLGGNEFLDLDTAAAAELVAESSYDEKDLVLYALGVGAGRNGLDPDDLRYVYELDTDTFTPLPTYAVMPPTNVMLDAAREGRMLLPGMNFGFERLLHGEQYTEVKRPLPPRAKLKHTFRFKHAWDKDPHAVVTFGITTTDESGEELAYNENTLFVKGAGGWGGERGPSGDVNVPPDREPDAIVEERTDANQALLYRLCGDWNPLHADPAFARMFGLERPILHGLCTYGHVARHVMKAMCGDDQRLFKSIKVRFADSVYPGETLVTRIWKESPTRFIVEARVKERDAVVIRNAAVEVYAEVPTALEPGPAKSAKAEEKSEAAPKPAEAPKSEPAPLTPTSEDIFTGIGRYLAQNPELAGQIKTVFQINLTDPASSWAIDLKSGAGACAAGTASAPDVTLELSDANFIAMCLGKVDANKLYFGGDLKITGNLMASQKLVFLKKMDPGIVEAVIRERLGVAPTPGPAPRNGGGGTAQQVVQKGRSAEIFEEWGRRAGSDPGAVDGLKGHVVQFHVTDPAAAWCVEAGKGGVSVRQGETAKAEAVFTLSDEDLARLASGDATAEDLYQRGLLRVDGDVKLARALNALAASHR
jgi:3-hydroxyacyl-CoA dehydrogenase/3a,7a,12a-trihydroxy-5b-cholest-24-enoyl-CoA hydratase